MLRAYRVGAACVPPGLSSRTKPVKLPRMSLQDGPSLAEALGFTEEEIAENRAGRMSVAQRARMKTTRSWGRMGTVVMAVIVVAFIAVIAIVVLPKISKGPGSSTSVLASIGVLALIAVVMSISIQRTRRSLDKLVVARVETTEGVTRTREHKMGGNVGDPASGYTGTGGGIRYEVTIGDIRFFVRSKAVLDTFEDGRSYRGYYVGGGPVMVTLLSAEPSSDAS